MCKFVFIIISCFIIAIDIKKHVIYDSLNIFFILVAIFHKGLNFKIIENSLIGSGIYMLPAIVIYGYISSLIHKEAIGFGDIKLLMGIGYELGYTNIEAVHIYYTVAFLSASGFIIIYKLILKRKNNEIPFSPFLLSSFVIMMGLK